MSIRLAAARPWVASVGAIPIAHALASGAAAADPSPSPSAATTASSAVISDSAQLLTAFGLLLLFGALVVLMVVAFLYVSQRAYFNAVGGLARSGLISKPAPVSATAGQGGAASLGRGGGTGELAIAGSPTLSVGSPSTYVVTLGGAPTDGAWTADPAAAARITPTTGSSVSVEALQAGSIKLSAAAGGQTVTLGVTAEPPAEGSTALPFIGPGWGSIVVSIVIAVVVAVLGLAGILDGQAIAGLYGALVGYLFGVRTGAGGASSGGANEGASGGGQAGNSA
jgi:hypothetical protein